MKIYLKLINDINQSSNGIIVFKNHELIKTNHIKELKDYNYHWSSGCFDTTIGFDENNFGITYFSIDGESG